MIDDLSFAQWLLLFVIAAIFFTRRHLRTAIGARQRVKHEKEQLWPKEPPCATPFLGHQRVLSKNADRFLHLFFEWRTTYGLGYEVGVPFFRQVDL